MKEQLRKLIEVKSLVTFGIIGTFIFLACMGKIDPKEVVLFGGIILTYFFNKDKVKA